MYNGFYIMDSYTYQNSSLKCLLLQKDEVHPSFNMFSPPSPPSHGSIISPEASIDDLSSYWVD